jgi:hypothetical protein
VLVVGVVAVGCLRVLETGRDAAHSAPFTSSERRE